MTSRCTPTNTAATRTQMPCATALAGTARPGITARTIRSATTRSSSIRPTITPGARRTAPRLPCPSTSDRPGTIARGELALLRGAITTAGTTDTATPPTTGASTIRTITTRTTVATQALPTTGIAPAPGRTARVRRLDAAQQPSGGAPSAEGPWIAAPHGREAAAVWSPARRTEATRRPAAPHEQPRAPRLDASDAAPAPPVARRSDAPARRGPRRVASIAPVVDSAPSPPSGRHDKNRPSAHGALGRGRLKTAAVAASTAAPANRHSAPRPPADASGVQSHDPFPSVCRAAATTGWSARTSSSARRIRLASPPPSGIAA